MRGSRILIQSVHQENGAGIGSEAMLAGGSILRCISWPNNNESGSRTIKGGREFVFVWKTCKMHRTGEEGRKGGKEGQT